MGGDGEKTKDALAGSSTVGLLHNKVDKMIRLMVETSENQKKMNRVLQDLLKYGGIWKNENGEWIIIDNSQCNLCIPLSGDREVKLNNCTIPFLPINTRNLTQAPPKICENAEMGKSAMSLYLDIESRLLGNIPCSRMDVFLGMPAITNDSALPGGSVPYQGYGSDNTSFILLYFKTTLYSS